MEAANPQVHQHSVDLLDEMPVQHLAYLVEPGMNQRHRIAERRQCPGCLLQRLFISVQAYQPASRQNSRQNGPSVPSEPNRGVYESLPRRRLKEFQRLIKKNRYMQASIRLA